MIIDHTKKFIFIRNPKTASTTLSAYFDQYEHPLPDVYHAPISDILKWHPETEGYFKFMFVRNPYDRFISSWFNFTDPGAGHGAWNGGLADFGTLDNFVRNFNQSKWKTWVHFRPQSWYCSYGDKDNILDFVGRQENFDHDFAILCEKLQMPYRTLGRSRVSHHSTYQNHLNDELKLILFEIYKKDFELFGYDSDISNVEI